MSGPLPDALYASPEQLRYARVLAWGTRIGLALLVVSFFAYAFEWLTPLVPHDQLPQLWSQPVGSYLKTTGIPTGWGWVSMAKYGDIFNFFGIAVLAGASIPCLIAVVPLYAARRDKIFLAICLLEIAVLLLAASAILNVGH